MASSSSYSVLRQAHRLLNLGVVNGMTDEQLIDWFVSRRDEAAEAAFEALMIRHGPMVFRVCLNLLGHTHDTEDAFQAVFLVLAQRASSIRRRGSVASWLFGVAHRVASRARSEADNRRAHDVRFVVRASESHPPGEECYVWAMLHDEINRLPEGLRASVTLCYLEGLTYGAAALQLGVPEHTVRGRLARARERLRRRLTARGVTVPAGLLVAGTAGKTPACVPMSLYRSTIHIAFGFIAGKTANVLARGVLNSMLLNQLKVAAVVILLGIGGRFCAWNAVAGLIDDKAQNVVGEVGDKPAATAPAPASMLQTIPPEVTYRLSGAVRVEGTGDPVAGAKLRIHHVFDFQSPTQRLIESGADGCFAVNLPAGSVQVEIAEAPVGYYWVRKGPGWMDSLRIGPDEPAVQREYRVRKGTVWDFQFIRGAQRKPAPVFLSALDISSRKSFEAQADHAGRLHFALPSEGGHVALYVRESSESSHHQLKTGFLLMGLTWEPNFLPGELKEIARLEHRGNGFRLIDPTEKSSAVLMTAAPIEPVVENGRLVIRVALPDRDTQDLGAVTGQVLDDLNRPIPGALVGLAATDYHVSRELRHQSTTNAEGWYRLRDIPRRGIDGKPLKFQIVATKERRAGFVSPELAFKEGTTGKFQVVDPIRLKPGVAISGIVVDHRGKPVAGARVHSNKPVPHIGLSESLQTVRTDGNGRFTLLDLRPGMTQLIVNDGTALSAWQHVMAGQSPPVLLQLPEERLRNDVPMRKALARPDPLGMGQDAVEWQVGCWSDGQTHKLADDRGKLVVLYFWGSDFWRSVGALPGLTNLAAEFEPRGVVFRGIHRPDADEKHAVEEARRVLALAKAPLIFTLDQVRVARHSRGVTAQRYGVNNYPVVILVNHAGKIAFRSDMTAGDLDMAAVFMKVLTDPQVMTEKKANRLIEQAISAQIESVLKYED